MEGQQNQARSGALLRLSSDFGPQLISESVFGMAPGMNRRGLRRAKLILRQMRRRARLKYNLHVCLRQIDTSADESRKWNQCSINAPPVFSPVFCDLSSIAFSGG